MAITGNSSASTASSPKHFPFSIYYRVEGETIFVDAVIDQRRDPDSIRKQLERLGKHG